MKNILFITMLLGFGYSQCNESNWQEYYPNMEGCDLEGANLYMENLSGADLTEANLMQADLRGADLSNANLLGANLLGANLLQADLSNANLLGAWLGGAYLYQANFSNANLTDTNCWASFFVGTILENTIFDGADLTYAIFDENEDTYDDVSYEAGSESGDLNLDGSNNVLDVVLLVENILNP